MICPDCKCPTAVYRTIGSSADVAVVRYRKCLKCRRNFKTIERQVDAEAFGPRPAPAVRA